MTKTNLQSYLGKRIPITETSKKFDSTATRGARGPTFKIHVQTRKS